MSTPEHQQLAETTRLLVEGGVGQFLKTECEIEIDFWANPRPPIPGTSGKPRLPRLDIANWIRRFYLAELPLTVVCHEEVAEEDHQIGYEGSFVDFSIVKVTPELTIFEDHQQVVGSAEAREGEIGPLLSDSYFSTKKFALCALEVCRLQLSFGWEPRETQET